ncbi:FUSC family protein [Actinacidiphila acidipaludis]|uniref:FUSC family protein n=1 Tax=Actinacidiphila acidipaludis TaxID=2873382 RepID=A0ABS7Q1I1_9ACTN|nr:FUSC family protein [Streptomyces acidipaludis]MBY8876736.1 FUSC family protein [Streptomyces acidipaludis]
MTALVVTDVVVRSAHLPGGMVVIATVVAVLVSRSLHGTSLPHRLSALAYVPAIGILAAFTGRFMLGHAALGAAAYVGAVSASRYLMRFGGKVRRFGRLALTPLLSVLVVPVPPSAARATGPLWGGLAGLVAVAAVIAVLAVMPARPTREAAAAAGDVLQAAVRLRALPPEATIRTRGRAERALHRAALTVEDRLAAARLHKGADHSPLDELSAAVLQAEVLAARPAADIEPERWAAALDELRDRAATVRAIRAGEYPVPDAPAPRRRTGGRFDLQPQTRLSAQLAVAMAAAFAAGHLAFAHHWTWTVITSFVVCSAARGRGDVVHRSGLRIAGAFAGGVTGTLIAHLVAGEPPLAVVVIFAYLVTGLWLRDVTYAAWAFCVTSMLAVLYSMNGEQGAALLIQRPEGILLGSVCGIAAAFFVLPLRTETVLRGRAARALQVLQEVLAAARAEQPQPAEIRRLARAFDKAAQDLAAAAAPARAHRSLVHHPRQHLPRQVARSLPTPLLRALRAALDRIPRRRTAALGSAATGSAATHAADWADALAACAPAVRALAAAEVGELAAARAQLGLAALNTGQVRRRLGHRPDAEPPRRARSGPSHLISLNAALADLYDRLPSGPQPVPAPAPTSVPAVG